MTGADPDPAPGFVPLLALQQDLVAGPKSAARFGAYLDALRDEEGGMALPLPAFNPMAPEGTAERIQAWIDAGAEDVAARVVEEEGHGGFRVALVFVQPGGWTDPERLDFDHRFKGRAERRRGWCSVLLWGDRPVDVAGLAGRVQAALARRRWQVEHGDPDTLEAMCRQEVAAGALAAVPDGWPPEGVPPFAFLYGAEAAHRNGMAWDGPARLRR